MDTYEIGYIAGLQALIAGYEASLGDSFEGDYKDAAAQRSSNLADALDDGIIDLLETGSEEPVVGEATLKAGYVAAWAGVPQAAFEGDYAPRTASDAMGVVAILVSAAKAYLAFQGKL